MIKHVYIAAAIVVLAIIGGLLLHAYISDRLSAEHYSTLKQELKSELKDDISAINKVHDDAKTPAQIAAAVPQFFPGVTPKVVKKAPAVATPSVQPSINDGTLYMRDLPSAPAPSISSSPFVDVTGPSSTEDGDLIIPEPQVKAFWDDVAQCAKDKATLGTCQKQLSAAEERIKGGKWYTRVWHATKPIICSSLGGGIAAAAGAKPPVVAGTAAGAGAFCAIAGK